MVDDYVTRRAAYREEHLALARDAAARGELVLGGALEEPTNRALLVFRAADRSVAERFAERDPYVRAGIVTRWEIRPWRVVVGAAHDS